MYFVSDVKLKISGPPTPTAVTRAEHMHMPRAHMHMPRAHMHMPRAHMHMQTPRRWARRAASPNPNP